MTQTIREQLQTLVERWRNKHAICNAIGYLGKTYYDDVADELESILATPEPAVTVQPGWYCKDSFGLWRFIAEPTFDGSWIGVRRIRIQDGIITDPWPDEPNGGPECVMEVG